MNSPRRSVGRHGFTLMELVICVLVVALLVALTLVFLDRARQAVRRNYDSSHVRALHQALVMSGTKNDSYVLPSWLDRADTTVTGEAAAKDSTANIVSYLIYNGYIGPELCVSPAEENGSIQINSTYQYSAPGAAANPEMALWDPAFSVDFTNGKVGNFSYAHLLPFGPRRVRWSNTFSPTEPIVANRGPLVSAVNYALNPLRPEVTHDPRSNTLGIHGPRRTWEGHVAYNDNHVDFESTVAPPASLFMDRKQTKFADCLFFDEPEEPDDLNAVLGIFSRAGATVDDWASIWD